MNAMGRIITIVSAVSFLSIQAEITPYKTDSDTLQLWHLDQTGKTYVNAVTGGIDLFNWGQKGTDVSSFPGFSNAFLSNPGKKSNLQTAPDIKWKPGGSLRGVTGAFTWEMMIRPDLPIAKGVPQRLIQCAGDMHLSLTYSAESGYVWLTYWDVRLDKNIFSIRLENKAGHAYEAGQWFHVAITWDGAGSGKVYWTKLNDKYTGTANMIGTFSEIGIDRYQSSRLAWSGVFNNGGISFEGAIDEIRISGVARDASGFLSVSH